MENKPQNQEKLSAWKIKRLIKAGEDFKCPFHFPPFDGDATESFYDIDKFKNKPEFQSFLSIIGSLNIEYEYAFTKADEKKKKKRIFMVVKTGEIKQ